MQGFISYPWTRGWVKRERVTYCTGRRHGQRRTNIKDYFFSFPFPHSLPLHPLLCVLFPICESLDALYTVFSILFSILACEYFWLFIWLETKWNAFNSSNHLIWCLQIAHFDWQWNKHPPIFEAGASNIWDFVSNMTPSMHPLIILSHLYPIVPVSSHLKHAWFRVRHIISPTDLESNLVLLAINKFVLW